ncbi:protein phosphatase 1 regulatory subunit 42-like isoform X2 [Pomacea canaliculata]|uniref:protein phosphatase 1 regulatory subunit 42-like isoform X2 n=1 Tax=Pomacea canaliculata TaxID=400727 RepID=UPI000D73B40A|nr:protein phosphatase 1 regulatory subunit 42-like isoform X2 [Pomacea canaliculata]
MGRLTIDLITRGTSGYAKKKRDETPQQYVRRLTHLYLENRNISEVGEELMLCRNLVVLYLYDNCLTDVPCLNHNCNLTHLYLQNNLISKIENLSALTKLSKLYLGGNCITVVEGLEKLQQLQELHVENQQLPAGEQLLFDPRSLNAVSKSLEVLNVSGNKLESLRDLEVLQGLTQLYASDNLLNDIKELSQLLPFWTKLWRLELVGNPLCHKSKYKDKIIIMGKNLGMLDGKEVTDTAKQFLCNWHATRETQKKKREEFTRQGSFTGDLPPVNQHYPLKHSGTRLGYLMPGLPRKEFDEILSRNHGFGEGGPSKIQSGVFRSKQATGYREYRKTTLSSAPLRRNPLTSISIEMTRSLHPMHNIAPF